LLILGLASSFYKRRVKERNEDVVEAVQMWIEPFVPSLVFVAELVDRMGTT
jgi:hypothetical protein